MQLTERYVIVCNDPRYQAIDAAAFASKNLYKTSFLDLDEIPVYDHNDKEEHVYVEVDAVVFGAIL